MKRKKVSFFNVELGNLRTTNLYTYIIIIFIYLGILFINYVNFILCYITSYNIIATIIMYVTMAIRYAL